jgi:hypothetical protein
MRTAIKDLKTHAYLDVTVVYGRKPGGKPLPKEAPKPEPAKSTGYAGDVATLPEDYQGLP